MYIPSEKALKQKDKMHASILDTKIKILTLEIKMLKAKNSEEYEMYSDAYWKWRAILQAELQTYSGLFREEISEL